MKFKAGDKVKLISKSWYIGFAYSDNITIKRFIDYHEEQDICRYECYNGRYQQDILEKDLELIKDKQMTKEDLKSGMRAMFDSDMVHIVYIRDGEYYVIDDKGFFVELGYYGLISLGGSQLKKVYDIPSSVGDFFDYSKKGELLWEYESKKPIKEMTVSEIAKELGYEIKVVAND